MLNVQLIWISDIVYEFGSYSNYKNSRNKINPHIFIKNEQVRPGYSFRGKEVVCEHAGERVEGRS